MQRVLALLLAGGAGERLSVLVSQRAKPAVPFGGKYRIIDFALSNCANSGVFRVAALTQFNPRSLARHIGTGRPWDLDRSSGGVILLQPFLSRSGHDWYKGTADAVYQNLYYVEEQKVDEVLILSGDHIYAMRYDRMINFHRSRGADVTVGVVEVPMTDASRFGIVTLDHSGRVVAFDEKPKAPTSNLGSMGIYAFSKNALMSILEENARHTGGDDFGRDIFPHIINTHKVYGYRYRGYWRDVGTIESYYEANMDLLGDTPELNLYSPETEIRTVQQNLPPARFGAKARVRRSLIADGAVINGLVENSVISPNVFIERGAEVRNSIVFEDTSVAKGAVVGRCIIDKQVWIGAGSLIGYGDDMTANQEEPQILRSGITLVGKGAKIPEGTRIGRNCKVNSWVEKSDFSSDTMPSGSSLSGKLPNRHAI